MVQPRPPRADPRSAPPTPALLSPPPGVNRVERSRVLPYNPGWGFCSASPQPSLDSLRGSAELSQHRGCVWDVLGEHGALLFTNRQQRGAGPGLGGIPPNPPPLLSLSLSPSSPPPSPPKATCALHEIMSAPESGPAVLGLYAPLFVTLLLRVSCTVGVQLPKSLQGRERKSSSSSNAATSRSLQPCRYTGRIGVAVGSRRGTQAGWVDPALLCALGSAGFGFLYACGFLPVLPVVPVLGCPGDAEGPTLCP